jgi:N-acetylglutamate synthase-like GNAT family acetyltransferase
MSEPTLRPAAVNDAADIHTLLLRLAGEIPLAVETLEQEEALYAQLRKTLGWGESWVAEADGRIVGCVLVDNVQTGRHWGENEALDLRYAAGEALAALLAKVLERAAPVSTAVKDANRAGLADLLLRHGFHQTETRVGERRFRHEPGGQG